MLHGSLGDLVCEAHHGYNLATEPKAARILNCVSAAYYVKLISFTNRECKAHSHQWHNWAGQRVDCAVTALNGVFLMLDRLFIMFMCGLVKHNDVTLKHGSSAKSAQFTIFFIEFTLLETRLAVVRVYITLFPL